MRVLAAMLVAACTASTRTPVPAQREADPLASAPAPPTPCHNAGDCATTGEAMQCFAPDYAPGIGHAECESDSSCPTGSRCRGSVCVASCTATSCAAGQECGEHGDCEARHCSASNAARVCPHNFSCQQGRCARMPCTTDTDCEGTCVDGRCFAIAGRCEPASYCCPP